MNRPDLDSSALLNYEGKCVSESYQTQGPVCLCVCVCLYVCVSVFLSVCVFAYGCGGSLCVCVCVCVSVLGECKLKTKEPGATPRAEVGPVREVRELKNTLAKSERM